MLTTDPSEPTAAGTGKSGGKGGLHTANGFPQSISWFCSVFVAFFHFHWFSLFSSSNPPAIHTAPARRGSARAQGAEISGGGFHDPGSEDPTAGEPAARCY